jgi:hypothetical protein
MIPDVILIWWLFLVFLSFLAFNDFFDLTLKSPNLNMYQHDLRICRHPRNKTLLAQWLTRQQRRVTPGQSFHPATNPLTPNLPQSEKASHPLPTQQAVCSNRAATLTPDNGSTPSSQKDRHLSKRNTTFDDSRQLEGRQHKTTSPVAARL